MRFIVSSSSLLKQLQAVGGVLNTSNTLPILDNFLFEINDKELTICASDLDTVMSTSLEVEAKDVGKVAIPAKFLMDTLKTFPDQPLTFSIEDNFQIEISSDQGKYKLSGYNGEEFPKTPNIENPSNVVISGDTLASAINKTIFATGNDSLKPAMNGVYFQLSNDSLTFVATDAHKLVRYKRMDAKADKPSAFIVPKKPLNQLKNVIDDTEDVKIEFNESNAKFLFGKYSVVCRLIDGKYPNYEAVIPNENPNRLVVDKAAFQNSIKRVSIFANKTTNQVRLKIKGSELNINAEDLDFANAANERLTCDYEGEDMEIGFNSRFLFEMLTNINSEQVILEMSSPNRAGILFPSETVDTEENILMLVMPVMLNA